MRDEAAFKNELNRNSILLPWDSNPCFHIWLVKRPKHYNFIATEN